MPATMSPPANGVPARGLAGRLVGVLTAPRGTYAEIAADPQWLGALLAVLAITVSSVVWILSTEVGQQALVDQQLQALEAFGQTVTDEQYQRMHQMAPYSRYFAAAGQALGLPATILVIAGTAFAVFNGLLGDNATFRQVFAIVTFSSTVTALRALFSTPLNFARESLANPTSLAAVLPLFEESSFAGMLMGSIDLFLIWWAVSLGIGLGVLYKRRTPPIAMTLLGVYGGIGATIAAIRSMLAGA